MTRHKYFNQLHKETRHKYFNQLQKDQKNKFKCVNLYITNKNKMKY